MKVKECMTKNVICVGEYESADVAARLMARYNLGSLPVRRFDGSLSVTMPDKAPGSVRVGSVMTKRLVSVPENMDINLAARLMAREQVRRLPVTGQGGLVGLLTLADLSRVSDLSMEAGECLGEICAPVRHLD